MRGGEFGHVSRDDIQRFEQGIAEHLEQFGGRASILLGHHVPEDRCVPYQIARTDECAAKPPRCFRCGEAAVNPRSSQRLLGPGGPFIGRHLERSAPETHAIWIRASITRGEATPGIR